MPIPFLIGAAVVAGVYGLGKGLDASEDFDKAKALIESATEIYTEASDRLNEVREETNSKIKMLGEEKVDVYQGNLDRFVDLFSQIKNVNLIDNIEIDNHEFNEDLLLEIKETNIEINDVLSGGISSISAGALTGFGVYGGVGALGMASTGTAIGSLSGAAATNATLAWLGGGSIASGGLGMTAGAAVLGGIVLGPVLAVGGSLYASKARQAKLDAESEYEKAEAAVVSLDAMSTVLWGVCERVDEIREVLEKANEEYFEDSLDTLDSILERGNDFSKYSETEKSEVHICCLLAQTVKNICDTPILDKDGEITSESEYLLEEAQEVFWAVEDM